MRFYALFLAATLCMCLPVLAQDVTTDFDPDFDFSSARTFTWGEVGSVPGNDLSRKRLETAIQESLTAKGLEIVDEGGADLLVVYHAVVDQETKKRAVNVGVGVSRRVSKRGSVRVGASTSGKPKTIEVGTLVVDLLDGETKDLVWTATATGTLKGDADAREALVRSALEKAFSEFPPKD